MKKLRKVLAVVLAMAMVMGMSIVSLADTPNSTAAISVTGLASTGTNIVQYVKILEPDVKASGGYKFVSGVGIKGYSNAKSFLEATLAKQKAALEDPENVLPSKTTADASEISGTTFSKNVDAGYYAIWVTNKAASGDPEIVYSTPMIVSVEYKNATLHRRDDGTTYYSYDVKVNDPDNSVVAKYTTIPVIKESNDSDKAVAIGQEVTYTIETYIPSQAETYTLTDTLTGATYVTNNLGNVEVKYTIGNGTETTLDSNNIQIINADDSEEDTVTAGMQQMILTLTSLLNGNAGKKLTITYNAKVTATEVNNTVIPSDGHHDYEPSTESLYTGEITLTKTGEEKDEQGNSVGLAKAGFEVRKGEITEDGTTFTGSALTFREIKENNVVIAYEYDPEGSITKVVTGTNGTVTVKGLDVGTYQFKEVEAPEGYSINTTEECVAILSVEGTATETFYPEEQPSMSDTKLSALPSTGGIGTTIFTIVGCLLMIGAASILFVSRRRASK